MSLESIRKRLRSKTPPPMSTQQPSMHFGYIRKRLRSKTPLPQYTQQPLPEPLKLDLEAPTDMNRKVYLTIFLIRNGPRQPLENL